MPNDTPQINLDEFRRNLSHMTTLQLRALAFALRRCALDYPEELTVIQEQIQKDEDEPRLK